VPLRQNYKRLSIDVEAFSTTAAAGLIYPPHERMLGGSLHVAQADRRVHL
jgi:hypothetical protein